MQTTSARRRIPPSASAAILVATLVGCGSSTTLADSSTTTTASTPTSSTTTLPSPTAPTSTETSSGPTASDTTSSDGSMVSGTGYSYAVPDGWDDIINESEAQGADTFVRSTEVVDGFRTNINTVVNPAHGVTDLDTIRNEAATELEHTVGKRPSQIADITIAGERAIGQRAQFTTSGIDITMTQYATVHNDQFVVMTVTSATADVSTAVQAAQTVVSSWSWQ